MPLIETLAVLIGVVLSGIIAVHWVTITEKREFSRENVALRSQGRDEVLYLRYMWHNIWNDKKLSKIWAG